MGEVGERGISEMTTVTNGVNVQALLDAREVLKGAPEAQPIHGMVVDEPDAEDDACDSWRGIYLFFLRLASRPAAHHRLLTI